MFERTCRNTVLLPPLLGMILTGCGILDSEVRTFDEERTYEYALFPSPEACEAAQPPDFFVNCSQWMDFRPDGRVSVVLTDIVNPGEYGIQDDRVTLHMEGSPELPDRIVLILSADGSTLTEVGSGKVWTRTTGGG